MTPLSKGPWPWIGVVLCWGLAFTAACRLDAVAPPPRDDDTGLASLLFGSSRQAFSATLFDKADAYFHKGAEHAATRAFTNDWVQRVLADIAPEAHLHTQGRETAEILPWLMLATRSDPHNVEAHLVTAFWLLAGLHRPDLAEKALREARRNNPGDYRVLLELGRLDVKISRLARAADMMDAALVLWPRPLDPADLQARLDKAEILTYRAFLYELDGQPAASIRLLKNALEIFPERGYIGTRIAELESGADTRQSARMLLDHLSKRYTEIVCRHEDAEKNEHDHED